MPKRLIGIAIAAICIIVSCFIPGSEALSAEGARALGLLLALVALWITSALPLGVTALLIVVLCPVLGVVPNLGGASTVSRAPRCSSSSRCSRCRSS